LITGTGCEGRWLVLSDNPLNSPPEEVIAQGTPAIFEYLRHEVWWHLQRLLLGGASIIGIFASAILVYRWRRRGTRKKKR